ncbi:MAG TPA: TRAP transporter small permease subunit [Usitatibacter sp.]|nr:TRAP transporter small permease subunit [Usitatibacter sp.]
MDFLVRNIERVTSSIGVMASFALVPLVLATCYEVFARYIFGAPTIWAYEIGYILTGAHFLLAMAFALRTDEHIRIDIFSGHFSQRTRAAIDLAAYAVLLPLMSWISWALWLHLAQGYARNERSGQSAMNLPVWPFRVIFLVAFVLLALQILAEVVKSVRRFRKGGPATGST